MNVIEKIKNLPDDHLLYFSIVGKYWKLRKSKYDCLKQFKLYNPEVDNEYYTFYENGEMFSGGECVVFPSKDNRDWSNFTTYKVGNVVNINSNLYLIISITEDEISCFNLDTEHIINKKAKDFEFPIESEKYNPYKYLKPYDKVLVKECGGEFWYPAMISYTNNNFIYCMHSGTTIDLCIPYNYMTRHLAGTDSECPKCYKYW